MLISNVGSMPTCIYLPLLDRIMVEQRVEYMGLLKQCYVCHFMGHIAKECFENQIKERKGTSRLEKGTPKEKSGNNNLQTNRTKERISQSQLCETT